jgi:hypothetical protein
MTNFVLVPDKKQVAPTSSSKQRDYLLLDCSGSMTDESARWEEALAGVNAYIRKLATAEIDTKVTVAVFDDEYQVVRRDIAPSSCARVRQVSCACSYRCHFASANLALRTFLTSMSPPVSEICFVCIREAMRGQFVKWA